MVINSIVVTILNIIIEVHECTGYTFTKIENFCYTDDYRKTPCISRTFLLKDIWACGLSTGAVQLVIPKSGLKPGFTMVVVTRTGRLREWSQGEL